MSIARLAFPMLNRLMLTFRTKSFRTKSFRTKTRPDARYILQRITYPVLWVGLLAAISWVVAHPQDLALVVAVKGAFTVGLLLTLELALPLQKRWGPTWRLLFRRDVVLLLVNGAVAGLLNYGMVLLAVDAAQT